MSNKMIMEEEYCVICNGTGVARVGLGHAIYRDITCDHTLTKFEFQKHLDFLMQDRQETDDAIGQWEEAAEHSEFIE